jgi:RNA polymerase sigma factor (sigma-70 family)
MRNDPDLLQDYALNKSEESFAELVRRHLNLVYSAALRQVRSPQLAEEVAQSAFTDLARNAHRLTPDTILTAWLYQVTRRTAIDVVRRESRRQLREQIAVEMNNMNAADLSRRNSMEANWAHIEPLLDDAMHALDDTDRAAVLLRYFENKTLREVGKTLGTSDDAAQKRVSRAVERLREFFAKRGVTMGAGGLVVVISANTVQAAPVGLAVTIAAAATFAGTTIATTTTATAIKTIVMTTLQKALISATLIAAVGVGLYEARQSSILRSQVQTLRQQQAPLAEQIQQLQRERDDATNRLAALASENATLKKNPAEVLKLRGEVGRLRQENASAAATSALNKITANPETRKLLRDQQKMGMTAIYKDLVLRLNLSPDLADKFNDLLADHVMDNVDQITEALRDGKSAAQINQVFAGQDAALQEKLQALIGPDGVSQYKDYTRNLGSTLTSAQFKAMLTGDDTAKQEKTRQLYQVMQEETQAALASAGLPPDYQTVPLLNFRNIASEEQGERSLKLFDGIYERVTARAGAFLSPEELAKFKEFRATALQTSRMSLTMNRKMMAPLSQ